MSNSDHSGDHRGAERERVAFKGQMRGQGSRRFTVNVIDLSTTGFRADAALDLDKGDLVWLTIPGLQGLEANVAWRDGYLYGFAFKQPLHPAVFDSIVRYAQGAS